MYEIRNKCSFYIFTLVTYRVRYEVSVSIDQFLYCVNRRSPKYKRISINVWYNVTRQLHFKLETRKGDYTFHMSNSIFITVFIQKTTICKVFNKGSRHSFPFYTHPFTN